LVRIHFHVRVLERMCFFVKFLMYFFFQFLLVFWPFHIFARYLGCIWIYQWLIISTRLFKNILPLLVYTASALHEYHDHTHPFRRPFYDRAQITHALPLSLFQLTTFIKRMLSFVLFRHCIHTNFRRFNARDLSVHLWNKNHS